MALVDYGLGNLRAFEHIYSRLNYRVEITKDLETINKAEALILPGVGAFDWAMTKLNHSGLRPALEEKVLVKKTPILGVCVGMQMLAEGSEEGRMSGLGWIGGRVRKLVARGEEGGRLNEVRGGGRDLILPHMGWNDVLPTGESPLFHGIEKPQFYFLHSYYFASSDPTHSLGTTEYDGIRFTSALGKGNIYGVQFHPEKSHGWGIQMLKNFGERC